MRKYVYENATVYITKPTEEQIKNIHETTERFAKKLIKKGLIKNETRKNNRRTGRSNFDARKRNKQPKSEN